MYFYLCFDLFLHRWLSSHYFLLNFLDSSDRNIKKKETLAGMIKIVMRISKVKMTMLIIIRIMKLETQIVTILVLLKFVIAMVEIIIMSVEVKISRRSMILKKIVI